MSDEQLQSGGSAPPSSNSLKSFFFRRRQLIAVSLGILILVALPVLIFILREDLQSRSTAISVGMSQEQVEKVLGPAVLDMSRTGGRGSMRVWVDQFWQLDVIFDRDGRVESIGCRPSDSMYRRTMKSFTALFK